MLSTAFYSNELNAIRFWNINNNSLYIAPENRITEFNLSMKNSLFNGLSRLNGIQSAGSNCESIHSTTSTYLNHICGFCGLVFKNSTLFNRKVLGQPWETLHFRCDGICSVRELTFLKITAQIIFRTPKIFQNSESMLAQNMQSIFIPLLERPH